MKKQLRKSRSAAPSPEREEFRWPLGPTDVARQPAQLSISDLQMELQGALGLGFETFRLEFEAPRLGF